MTLDPNTLRGLWQREIITYPDGHTDSSLRIFWMQAQNLYADFRIPYDFVSLRPDACLETLTTEEMAALARLGGFAGRVVLDGPQCRWIRAMDWQPFTGVDDVAQITFDGLDLVEDGGACGGHQIWRRRTPLHVSALGLELKGAADGRYGVLVALADQFIYARGRLEPLTPCSGLAELLARCEGDREAMLALFDAEVSYGTISPQGSWTIALSTLPWRAGDLLFPAGTSLAGSTLAVQERDRLGEQVPRLWNVIDCEESGSFGAGLKAAG